MKSETKVFISTSGKFKKLEVWQNGKFKKEKIVKLGVFGAPKRAK